MFFLFYFKRTKFLTLNLPRQDEILEYLFLNLCVSEFDLNKMRIEQEVFEPIQLVKFAKIFLDAYDGDHC